MVSSLHKIIPAKCSKVDVEYGKLDNWLVQINWFALFNFSWNNIKRTEDLKSVIINVQL